MLDSRTPTGAASADPWAVREEDFPARGPIAERLRFLVRYAVLAPSPRNTQPWRFGVDDRRVCLYADFSRRQRVADPHDRNLYISLGCALENLLVAGAHFGFSAEIDYFPMSDEDELVAQVWFGGGAPAAQPDALFDAITLRRTQNASVEVPPVDERTLAELYACRSDGDLALLLTQDAPIRRAVEGMLARAGALVHANPAYLEELAACAAQRERSVFAGVPAFGLISAGNAGRLAQVKAGRLFERLSLRAVALGLFVQPLSALLEFAEVTAAFARLFRAGGLPLMPFRLGHARAAAQPAPRRPLEEVLA